MPDCAVQIAEIILKNLNHQHWIHLVNSGLELQNIKQTLEGKTATVRNVFFNVRRNLADFLDAERCTSPGLAALMRSDRFVSGAVCFVRRTVARSAFLGF